MIILPLLKLKPPYRNYFLFFIVKVMHSTHCLTESKAANWGKYNVKHVNNKVFCLINLSVTAANVIILMECQDK